MDCERPLNGQCHSFGSTCRPSSQPRKISRGVLINSGTTCKPKSSKEGVVDLTEERRNPNQPEEDGKRVQSVREGNSRKRLQSLEQQTSLLSSRAVDKKISSKEVHDVFDGATEVKHTFSANHTNLKAGVEGNARPQRQHGKVVSESKHVNAEVTHKSSFVPGQPSMPEDNADKAQSRGSETLRDSLWKILETVSTPEKQHLDDFNLKNEAKESDQFRKNKEEVNPAPISRHSADTKESDRSLRRSSARKRASNEVERNRNTETSLHNNKDKQRKKVHPSTEGFIAGSSVQGTVSRNLQQKGEREGSVSEKLEMRFNELEHQKENLQANIQRKSFVNNRKDANVSYNRENSNFIRPNNLGLELGTVQHPLGNTSEHPMRVDDSPTCQGNMDCPNDLGHSSLKNNNAQKPEIQRENLQANSQKKSFVNTRTVNKVSFSSETSNFIRPKDFGVETGFVQSEHPMRVDDSPRFLKNMDGPYDLGHSPLNNTIARKPENLRENRQADSQKKSFVNTRKGNNVFYSWEKVDTSSVQHSFGNTSENSRRVNDSPKFQENMDSPNVLGHSSPNNTMAHKPDAESPTFKLQTPTKSATCSQPCEMTTPSKGLSYGSLFKHVSSSGRGELHDHACPEKSGIKSIKSFKKLLASRQNDLLPDSEMNFSTKKHDAEGVQGTVGMFEEPTVVEKSAKGFFGGKFERSESETSEEAQKSESSEEARKSESSEEDQEPEPSEEDCNIQGHAGSVSPSSENVFLAKGTSVLVQDKKPLYQAGFRAAGFRTNLASEKGTSRHDLGSTDQHDEFSRAVILFSSALEGLKSKMQLAARKRSADILMSVADRIQLQLQNTESNIHADVRKMSSFSKSKKKQLELRCEEIQGELDAMHQKFREEFNRHLQKCKSAVEGLEAQEQELKLTVEKQQRASQRKLIREAEKAIEADLSDAQTKLSAVQNSTKGKMLELKKLMSELLKEGIIT